MTPTERETLREAAEALRAAHARAVFAEADRFVLLVDAEHCDKCDHYAARLTALADAPEGAEWDGRGHMKCSRCGTRYSAFSQHSCATGPPSPSNLPATPAPERPEPVAIEPPTEDDVSGNPKFAQSFDGREWARAFLRISHANPGVATDEATMTGWFANAIMRGYDDARREARAPASAPQRPEPVATNPWRTLTPEAADLKMECRLIIQRFEDGEITAWKAAELCAEADFDRAPASAPRPWRESETVKETRDAVLKLIDEKYVSREWVVNNLCDAVAACSTGPSREQVKALCVPDDGDPTPGDKEWRGGHDAAITAVLALYPETPR